MAQSVGTMFDPEIDSEEKNDPLSPSNSLILKIVKRSMHLGPESRTLRPLRQLNE